jgi:lycopene beta-cyclase
MLAASTDLASAIGKGVREGHQPDSISAAAYGTLWGKGNRGQRDFQSYGGDFLMNQKVDILRGFFAAFFQLDAETWSGFLAGWPGLPGDNA